MNKLISRSYLTLFYSVLYLPIIIVICFSFNAAERSQIWHGFTWHWYQALWNDSEMITVAWHSLTIAITSATIASVMGLIAAISLYRYRFFGKPLMSGVIFMLIIIPDLVLGIALLLLYRILNLELGFYSILIAHITFSIPFTCVMINSQLSTLNKHLLEAATDLGAGEYILFKRIIIPLLLHSIIAGWLLAFTLSIDDVVISYFVSGPDFEILPLKIFSMVKLGVSPEINALSTVMLLLTLSVALLSHWLLKKR